MTEENNFEETSNTFQDNNEVEDLVEALSYETVEGDSNTKKVNYGSSFTSTAELLLEEAKKNPSLLKKIQENGRIREGIKGNSRLLEKLDEVVENLAEPIEEVEDDVVSIKIKKVLKEQSDKQNFAVLKNKLSQSGYKSNDYNNIEKESTKLINDGYSVDLAYKTAVSKVKGDGSNPSLLIEGTPTTTPTKKVKKTNRVVCW